MRSFLRFLRPMAFLRRKAVLSGLLGGNRKWLYWGGAAWVLHWIGGLLGTGQPEAKYIRTLEPGERLLVVHESESPLATKKAARRARRRASR